MGANNSMVVVGKNRNNNNDNNNNSSSNNNNNNHKRFGIECPPLLRDNINPSRDFLLSSHQPLALTTKCLRQTSDTDINHPKNGGGGGSGSGSGSNNIGLTFCD